MNSPSSATLDGLPSDPADARLNDIAQTTLAYVGRALELDTVAEAMADPALAHFVHSLLHYEVVATLKPVPGLDLSARADAVLARLADPSARQSLAELAAHDLRHHVDGLVEVIADALAHQRSVQRLAVPVAAWIAYVRRDAQLHHLVGDAFAEAATGSDVATAMLAQREVFPAAVAEDPRFRHALAESLVHFLEGDVTPLLRR